MAPIYMAFSHVLPLSANFYWTGFLRFLTGRLIVLDARRGEIMVWAEEFMIQGKENQREKLSVFHPARALNT
jgi:hypothetical protein